MKTFIWIQDPVQASTINLTLFSTLTDKLIDFLKRNFNL